jgi:DNA-binding NarL/FixJ family response regulator
VSEKTVVIVEDEVLLALELEDLCADLNCQVLGVAASAQEAREKFAGLRPDMLITDMELAEGSDGIEVAQTMRRRHPGIGIVFLTATTSPDKLRRIAQMRPHRLLSKPLRTSDLRQALSALG